MRVASVLDDSWNNIFIGFLNSSLSYRNYITVRMSTRGIYPYIN